MLREILDVSVLVVDVLVGNLDEAPASRSINRRLIRLLVLGHLETDRA